MARLDGRAAIVTGAAGGLGAAQVAALSAAGAHVVAGDVAAGWPADGMADQPANGSAGAIHRLRHDVRSLQGWLEVVAATEDRFGPVGVLVNNAGVVRRSFIEEMSEAEYREVVDTNQVGVFLGIKSVVVSMRKAGGGSIVNIASMDSIIAHPGIAGYVSSKFAVRGLTKVAALELGKDRIRVNAVCPGIIDTPMVAAIDDEALSGQPIPRKGTPDEVAQLVLFLASDDASYATGAEYVLDGGYTAT